MKKHLYPTLILIISILCLIITSCDEIIDEYDFDNDYSFDFDDESVKNDRLESNDNHHQNSFNKFQKVGNDPNNLGDDYCLAFDDNYIYFCTNPFDTDNQGILYRISYDGKEMTEIYRCKNQYEKLTSLNVYGNYLYAICSSEGIIRIDLNTFEYEFIGKYERAIKGSIFVFDGVLFYDSITHDDTLAVYAIDLDTLQKTEVLRVYSEEFITFSTDNKYVYAFALPPVEYNQTSADVYRFLPDELAINNDSKFEKVASGVYVRRYASKIILTPTGFEFIDRAAENVNRYLYSSINTDTLEWEAEKLPISTITFKSQKEGYVSVFPTNPKRQLGNNVIVLNTNGAQMPNFIPFDPQKLDIYFFENFDLNEGKIIYSLDIDKTRPNAWFSSHNNKVYIINLNKDALGENMHTYDLFIITETGSVTKIPIAY